MLRLQPPPGSIRFILSVLLLLGALILVHGPSLGGHFMQGWDDRWLVTTNRHVHGFSEEGLRAVLDPTIDRSSLGWEYLPLRDITYMIDFEIWGLNPVGYRISNLLVHASAAVAVLLLLHRLFGRSSPAPLLGALVFAVHPLSLEPVAWISGRKDGLAMLLSMGSALALLRSCEAGRPSRSRWPAYGLSLVLGSLALLSKSSAVGLLTAFPLLLLVAPREAGTSARSLILRTLPHAGIALLAAAVHFFVFARGDVVEGTSVLTDRTSSLGAAILHAFRTVALPVELSAHYRDPSSQPILTSIVMVLLIGLSGLSLRCLMRGSSASPGAGRSLGFTLLWILVAMGPVLAPLPRSSAYLADRYAYPALLALSILVTSLIIHSSPRTALRIVLGCVLVLSLAFLTSDRSRVWRSEIILWTDAVESDPLDARSRFNLGVAFERIGLVGEAILEYEACLAIEPGDVHASSNLAVLLSQSGEVKDLHRAEQLFRRAIDEDPGFHQARAHYAAFLMDRGRLDEAADQIEKGLGAPTGRAYVPLLVEEGNLYMLTGEPGRALEAYDDALRMDPTIELVKRNRQRALEALEGR